MNGSIFARAGSGSERLYKVFWFLWVPFLALTLLIRKLTPGLAWEGFDRSSSWTEYVGYLAFGIIAAWMLISIWKCASNVNLRVWFWLSRIYVVVQFLGLLQTVAIFVRMK